MILFGGKLSESAHLMGRGVMVLPTHELRDHEIWRASKPMKSQVPT